MTVENLPLVKANSHGKFSQDPSRHLRVIDITKNSPFLGGISENKTAYFDPNDAYFKNL